MLYPSSCQSAFSFWTISFCSSWILIHSPFLFYSLSIFLVIFRAWGSSRTSCSNMCLSKSFNNPKSFIFQLNMTSNIIKDLDTIIVSQIDLHVLPAIREGMNYSLNLLFLYEIVPCWFQLPNHIRHVPQLLFDGMIGMFLTCVKLDI